jgi:hypothetical protein
MQSEAGAIRNTMGTERSAVDASPEDQSAPTIAAIREKIIQQVSKK